MVIHRGLNQRDSPRERQTEKQSVSDRGQLGAESGQSYSPSPSASTAGSTEHENTRAHKCLHTASEVNVQC